MIKLQPNKNYSRSLSSACWSMFGSKLFYLIPRPLHKLRNILLRIFGANLHPTARVYSSVKIYDPKKLIMHGFSAIDEDVNVYNVDFVEIGKRTTISQGSVLITASKSYPMTDEPRTLMTAPILIGDYCWIGAYVFLAPGVEIENNVTVLACNRIFADISSGTTVKAGDL